MKRASKQATKPTSVVVGHKVGYRFLDGEQLFSGLEFTIKPGRHGLVGANGAGKSTLAKLIAGELEPTEGTITRLIPSDRILYLPQQLASDPDWTIADELGLGLQWHALRRIQEGAVDSELFEILAEAWDVEERARKALQEAGLASVELSSPVMTLSPGERMRARLARVRLSDIELLVLDEPTNHLDPEAREDLSRLIASFHGTLILISHDAPLLRQVDQVWELSEPDLKSYGGDFDFFEETRASEAKSASERLARARSELERRRSVAQEALLKQLHRIEHARKFADTGLPKVHRGNMKRQSQETLAKVSDRHERLIESAEERVREAEERHRQLQALEIRAFAAEVSERKILVEARDLNFTRGERRLWREGVSFDLHGRQRLALRGANGVGKSTLLQTVLGQPVPFKLQGMLKVRARAIASVDQSLALFDSTDTLLEIFRSATPGLSDPERLDRLHRFLFTDGQILKPSRNLSGGERMRAAFVCALSRDPAPELLILDEPDNDLDLESLSRLATVLRDLPCAMLVATHDPELLRAMGVDESLWLERDDAWREAHWP